MRQHSRFASAEYFWQQSEIARELVRLGNVAAIPAIEKHLKTEDRRRRCNAAFVLAGLGDDRGAPIIIGELNDKAPRPTEMTRSDGKPNIEGQIVADRYFAALLLGRLECRDAVPDLIRATQDDPINYRAAISLGQISDQRAIPALRKMAEECLKQRHWAGYGLALLGEQKGFDVLAEVVASSSSWTQRRHSVRALGAVGDPVATPTLIEALNDDHVNVRISAARALSKIGDPIALPALTESLNDTEVSKIHAPTTVQYEALKAMEAIAPADESRAPTLFLESDS